MHFVNAFLIKGSSASTLALQVFGNSDGILFASVHKASFFSEGLAAVELLADGAIAEENYGEGLYVSCYKHFSEKETHA
jgi:hypothetical protein